MIDFPPLPSGEKPVWDGEGFQLGERSVRVISYSSDYSGWDDDLTDLHESETDSGRHPIDIASRKNAVDSLVRCRFPEKGKLLEIGCSSGFLLQDLKGLFPDADIIGSDVTLANLDRLGEHMPGIPLLQMDILQCPLRGQQFDAVVALNVLEHIDDDREALRTVAGLLKPGGILVLEVPYGRNLYDYFDAYLRHVRRYAKKELREKIQNSGFEVLELGCLGFFPYPAFWLVKKMNRIRFGPGDEKPGDSDSRVRKQIRQTAGSRVLEYAFLLERTVFKKVPAPAGIRCIAVARRLLSQG